MLSPYSFHYLWKYEIGKQYICKLANELLNDNEEYVLLPFFNEKLNNVRSYVILESSSKILFIDFNFIVCTTKTIFNISISATFSRT